LGLRPQIAGVRLNHRVDIGIVPDCTGLYPRDDPDHGQLPVLRVLGGVEKARDLGDEPPIGARPGAGRAVTIQRSGKDLDLGGTLPVGD